MYRFTPDERTCALESFESTTGRQLLKMGRDDFLTTEPVKGEIIFEALKGVYPPGINQTQR